MSEKVATPTAEALPSTAEAKPKPSPQERLASLKDAAKFADIVSIDKALSDEQRDVALDEIMSAMDDGTISEKLAEYEAYRDHMKGLSEKHVKPTEDDPQADIRAQREAGQKHRNRLYDESLAKMEPAPEYSADTIEEAFNQGNSLSLESQLAELSLSDSLKLARQAIKDEKPELAQMLLKQATDNKVDQIDMSNEQLDRTMALIEGLETQAQELMPEKNRGLLVALHEKYEVAKDKLKKYSPAELGRMAYVSINGKIMDFGQRGSTSHESEANTESKTKSRAIKAGVVIGGIAVAMVSYRYGVSVGRRGLHEIADTAQQHLGGGHGDKMPKTEVASLVSNKGEAGKHIETARHARNSLPRSFTPKHGESGESAIARLRSIHEHRHITTEQTEKFMHKHSKLYDRLYHHPGLRGVFKRGPKGSSDIRIYGSMNKRQLKIFYDIFYNRK